MKEAYILTKSRTNDYIMTIDNYQESLSKILNELNKQTEDYINIYLSFDFINHAQRKKLFKAICKYISTNTINKVNLHLLVADTEFIEQQTDIVALVYFMIERYRMNEKMDIVLNMIIDGNYIKHNQIKLARLVKSLRIWLHIQPNNIKDLSSILYKLSFHNLLKSTLVTFDIDPEKDMDDNLMQTLKRIPRDVLIYLINSYLDETSTWSTRFNKVCFDPNGERILICPNYDDCLLVRKNKNKLNMVPILKKIVYSLCEEPVNISYTDLGSHCDICPHEDCVCCSKFKK